MSTAVVDARGRTLWYRRIAATAIDYAIVLGYVGVLLAVGLPLWAAGWLPVPSGGAGRVLSQVAAGVLLGVPVTVWLAAQEARRGATLGKRRLGLTVLTNSGERPGWTRALGRAVGKVFVPWELAHTAVWDLALGRGGPVDIVLLVMVYGLVIGYAVTLVTGSGRTPYDRLTGTSVVRVSGWAATC